MKAALIGIAFVLQCFCIIAQEKIFIKEFTYKAGEMDSKISSRAIAVNQLRSMLLNEVGVYVKSEQILKTVEVAGTFSQDFIENIATISAGITKLEVLEEKWNGEIFWMKAAITIDIKSFEESVKQISNDKQRLSQLKDLRQQLANANERLVELTQQVKNGGNNDVSTVQKKYNGEIDELNSSEFIYSGIVKGESGDNKGAIEDFSKAIEINSQDANAYANRGHTKSLLQDHVGAIRDFNMAIELNPKNAYAYAHRGLEKSLLGDLRGAIEDFNKSIELNPKDALAYGNRGHAKSLMGDHKKAIQDLTKAIELDPKDASAYYNRGIAKGLLGDEKGGCLDLSKAGELGLDLAYDAIKNLCK